MNRPPFSIDLELYRKLSIKGPSTTLHRTSTTGATSNYLPSQPQIPLNSPAVGTHLESEFLTSYLDNLSKIFILIATPRSSHISSLTHQQVRRRHIVITELPGLHLVWHQDRIFLKPIPKYLFSHVFWTTHLNDTNPSSQNSVRRAALGFLRSYSYLVQHPSDFVIAQDSARRLIPKNVKYREFKVFIDACQRSIDDRDVSRRYQFGELRLSRLNFWSQVLLRRFAYHKVAGDYASYFAEYFKFLLFLFAGLSVALSAMQVALSVQPILGLEGRWLEFVRISLWFSTSVIIAIAAIVLFMVLKFLAMGMREVSFAVRATWKRERQARISSPGV